MTVWQSVYFLLLIWAVLIGRPDVRVVVAVFANLLLTITLASSTSWVAVLDLATACFLIWVGGKQANYLSFVYSLLVPVYVTGDAIGLTKYTTYAIVDIAAIAILLLLIGPGGGRRIRNCISGIGRNAIPSAILARNEPTGFAASSPSNDNAAFQRRVAPTRKGMQHD